MEDIRATVYASGLDVLFDTEHLMFAVSKNGTLHAYYDEEDGRVAEYAFSRELGDTLIESLELLRETPPCGDVRGLLGWQDLSS